MDLHCGKDTNRNYCSKQFFALSFVVLNQTVEAAINWLCWEMGRSRCFLGGRKRLGMASPWTLAKVIPMFVKLNLLKAICQRPYREISDWQIRLKKISLFHWSFVQKLSLKELTHLVLIFFFQSLHVTQCSWWGLQHSPEWFTPMTEDNGQQCMGRCTLCKFKVNIACDFHNQSPWQNSLRDAEQSANHPSST